MTRYAILDLETTGLDERAGDRIVEVAVLVVDRQLREVSRLDTLVAPGRAIDATHVHGITDADVAGAPTFAQLAPRLGELLEGATIVGHYPRFDLRFLDMELQRLGLGLPAARVVDTRDTCRAAGVAGRLRMIDCCAALSVGNDRPHTAMGDALTTRDLLATCTSHGIDPSEHDRAWTARVVRPGWPTRDPGDALALPLPRALRAA
jgi:DNA polymerase-3 subunit epsilon